MKAEIKGSEPGSSTPAGTAPITKCSMGREHTNNSNKVVPECAMNKQLWTRRYSSRAGFAGVVLQTTTMSAANWRPNRPPLVVNMVSHPLSAIFRNMSKEVS